jgi:hypothetical protein
MKIIQFLSFVCTLMLVSLQPGIAGDSDASQAETQTSMKTAADGATMAALPNNVAGDSLSPFQIFEKTREKYASLTSYSDEGQAVATLNDATINTSFTIRMARTNFYWIGWQQTVESFFSTNYAQGQAVWSSGAGNFLDTGLGPHNEESREVALAKARENSGGAAVTIPRVFFNIPWGDQFGDAWFAHDRLTDENVGVDCYVLSAEVQGQTRTFWIGKQDFLIRQVRAVTSADVLQEMMAKDFNWDCEKLSGIQKLTLTEMHTNIIVDKPFLRSDFIPSNGE